MGYSKLGIDRGVFEKVAVDREGVSGDYEFDEFVAGAAWGEAYISVYLDSLES